MGHTVVGVGLVDQISRNLAEKKTLFNNVSIRKLKLNFQVKFENVGNIWGYMMIGNPDKLIKG